MLELYETDVYVIQECEDPKQSNSSEYKAWAGTHLWLGTSHNKGLGVFAKNQVKLTALNLDPENLESFIPCMLNDKILFLAVWTKQANSPTFGYIGQLWKYLQKHRTIFSDKDAMIIGDLNSNACWDKWDRCWNHSDVVRELDELGISSLYHNFKCEAQGSESIPTFYMHRKLEKPYHIDYAFLTKKWCSSASIEIGDAGIWLKYSDHMPLLITLEIPE
jgi:hypothetical protein